MTSLTQPTRKGIVTLKTGVEHTKSIALPFVDTSSGKVTNNSVFIPLWTLANLLEPYCQTLRVLLKNAHMRRDQLKIVDIYFSALHRKSEAVSVSTAITILDNYAEYRTATSTAIRIARTVSKQLKQSSFITSVIKEIESRELGAPNIAAGALSKNMFIGKYSFKPIQTAAWELPNISKKYKDKVIKLDEPVESCRPSEPVRTIGNGSAIKSKKYLKMIRLSGSLDDSQKAKCVKNAKRLSKVLNKAAQLNMSIPPIKRPVTLHFQGSTDELKDIFNKLDIELQPKEHRGHMLIKLSELLKEGLLTGDLYGELPCRSFESLSLINSRIVKWQAIMDYITEDSRIYTLHISRISEPNKPEATLLSKDELQPWKPKMTDQELENLAKKLKKPFFYFLAQEYNTLECCVHDTLVSLQLRGFDEEELWQLMQHMRSELLNIHKNAEDLTNV